MGERKGHQKDEKKEVGVGFLYRGEPIFYSQIGKEVRRPKRDKGLGGKCKTHGKNVEKEVGIIRGSRRRNEPTGWTKSTSNGT